MYINNDDAEGLRKAGVDSDDVAYLILEHACEKASLAIVQYILPYVRDINTKPTGCDFPRTPLGSLCRSMSHNTMTDATTIMQLLLDHGADPHKVYDPWYMTPFEYMATSDPETRADEQAIRMFIDQCDCRMHQVKQKVHSWSTLEAHAIEKEVLAPRLQNCRKTIAGLLVSASRSRLLCRDIALCIARFMWEYRDDRLWKEKKEKK